MSLRTSFMILAVILLVGYTVSAPGGKHGSRVSDKPAGKVPRRPVLKGGNKGGGKGGAKAPAVQQTTDRNRLSLPLDILPYHYTVSIVPDLDNSTFFGEVVIDFEAERATQEIVLHAANLQIDYDKLVLTERRCTPPSLVETTSAQTATPSSSNPENVTPTAKPSSSTTSAPVTAATQSQTSAPETSINPEESSVTHTVEMPSPAPALEESPAMLEEALTPAMEEAPVMEGEVSTSPMEEAPAPAMGEVPGSATVEVEAPPMEEAAAPATEEAAPAPAMEEAAAPAMEEAASPAMEGVAASAMKKAPPPAIEAAQPPAIEEAPSSPMEAAAPSAMEGIAAPAMEEAAAPTMEEAAAPAMEEAAAPTMEEAPSQPTEEDAAPAMEGVAAPATEEAAAPAMEEAAAPTMEEVAEPAMEEVQTPAMEGVQTPAMEGASAPAVEEAAVEFEKVSAMSEEIPAVSQVVYSPDEAPIAHDEVLSSHKEIPVLLDEAPSMPDDTPVLHEEAPPMSEQAPVSPDHIPSISEESPVVPEVSEKAHVEASAAPSAIVDPIMPTTTIIEQPTETTTVKDTFNLAGEALKILEVLNRSDIIPFIKANLTDDGDFANLSEDGIIGQEPDNMDIFMDKVETRTDDLEIEDCQKIEVFQPPPANFVNPPAGFEEGLEQTTAGMFNSLRTALEQLVQTTLAPLLKDHQTTTNEIITTASSTKAKSDILRTTDKTSAGLNTINKNSEIEITTVEKNDVEITTDGKSYAEITTDGKSVLDFTTDGKSEVEITNNGKSEVYFTTDRKSDIMTTTEGKFYTETTTYRKPESAPFNKEKTDVETTSGKFEIGSTTEVKPDIESTTYKTGIVEQEPLQREELSELSLPNVETTLLEKTTFETATLRMRESTDMPTVLPDNLVTESSTDSLESMTTQNNVYFAATTEKSVEGTTEYTQTRKSRRNRRAVPKRKRRPTNRNKLKQSVKLCTSEDLYEVRVDKALSPSKRRTELETPDIGVQVEKDKIRQEDHDALVLPTKTPLKAGKRYRLTMSFSGKMTRRPAGMYRSDYVVEEGGRRKTKYVASTVFEPIHARRVFPCLDDPRYRARFSMRIAHPPNLSAYSNMPASTTSDDVDSTSSSGIPSGWLWDRFETSPPMPTYLVAFFVGALARKSRTVAGAPGQNNLMVRLLARRERLRDASFALNLAPKVMMEMGQWLNKPTSLSKLDLLALPGPGPDAVENWGLVSFQERYLLTQPGLLSRFSVASVLSHELAHDWFGNLVTPHHWKYAWLSEGLATYSSARILNKIQPAWDVEDLATVSAYITAMTSDDDDAVPMQPKKLTANNYRAVFSPASYYKGYMTMRMLKGVIGEEMLTESLRRYVQQNAFGWAKSSRLWAAVNETATQKNVTLDLPRSLPKLMASWIEAPGYPLVTVTRNYTSGEVFVQQTRHTLGRSEVESNTTWWIPLRAWTAKTTGATLQWLSPSSNRKAIRLSSVVSIGADQWLMANAEFSGPMRVQYDLNNWDLLAAALPNGNLPRGAGAQLSVDALTFAGNGQLPFGTALKVVSAALESRTGDAHLTWTAASPLLRRIDRELRATKASRPYRQWLHRLITPLDTWISFDSRNDTVPDAVLARHVTTAACSLAMPLCLSTGRSQFRTWMASNTPEPRVPIELRGTLYCAAVRDGTSDTVWRFLWSKISTAPTDERIRILKGLGCTRDPELAKRLLQLAADVKSPVYKKQLPTIVRSIAMHDAGPGVVLSFLAENIQKFANDSKTLRRLLGEVAPAVNSKKDMKKLQGLLPQVTTSRATIAKVSADATSAMERSQRLSQGIFAYFNKSKKTT